MLLITASLNVSADNCWRTEWWGGYDDSCACDDGCCPNSSVTVMNSVLVCLSGSDYQTCNTQEVIVGYEYDCTKEINAAGAAACENAVIAAAAACGGAYTTAVIVTILSGGTSLLPAGCGAFISCMASLLGAGLTACAPCNVVDCVTSTVPTITYRYDQYVSASGSCNY